MSSRRITCPGCDAVWAGLNIEHCAGCHRTFSSTQAGDAHRTGVHGVSRRCMTDTEIDSKVISSGEHTGQPWFRVGYNAFGTAVYYRNTPGKTGSWSGPSGPGTSTGTARQGGAGC